MSSELVPHQVTLALEPGDLLVGLVSLRLKPGATPAEDYLSAVGHRLDHVQLPAATPYLLRRLADELEIEMFAEALDDIAPPA